jgi:hypothetical protein
MEKPMLLKTINFLEKKGVLLVEKNVKENTSQKTRTG